MVTELTERIAHMLCMAGWTSPNDAQWTYLERLLPDLREALMSVPNQPHKSGTSKDALDAARYRFLRDGEYSETVLLNLREAGIHRDDVDAAVDTAMNPPPKPNSAEEA